MVRRRQRNREGGAPRLACTASNYCRTATTCTRRSHIVASQSPTVCPFGEYLINHVPEKLHFIKDPPLTTNGLVQLPEKPGFGIELDPAKVEKQEVLTTL